MHRMIQVLIASFVSGALLGQEPADGNSPEAKRLLTASLEKSIAKGGAILKGRLEKSESGSVGLEIAGPDVGMPILGDFAVRLGKGGVASVTFEGEKHRYEIFLRGDKVAQRLAWSGSGVPQLGESAEDLGAILRWEQLLKHVDKAKHMKALPDAAVDGNDCRVVAASFPADAVSKPPKKSDDDGGGGGFEFKIEAVKATFHIGKADGAIRRLEIEISRKVELPGDQEAESTSRYSLTVQKFDPALTVEIPADLKKLLD